jgi:hypothetical protein
MDSGKVGLSDQGPQRCINTTKAKFIQDERIQFSHFVKCKIIFEYQVIVTVRGGQNVPGGHIGTSRWDGGIQFGPGHPAPAKAGTVSCAPSVLL